MQKTTLKRSLGLIMAMLSVIPCVAAEGKRPNILFIMTDDHAAHALSCYGSGINVTPNMDRIAAEGIRHNSCFCTNSICEPSRATILTGTYNHVNGVTTIGAHLDNRQENIISPTPDRQ